MRESFLPSKWTPDAPALEPSHEMRPCPECGTEHLLPVDNLAETCFRCWRAANPFEGCPSIRIDAAGDDSRDPRRVKDGTAGFNVGLRGVETPIGKRPDGSTVLDYRPISHNEVGSNRRRRELAKRQGLEVRDGVYRGLK